MKNTYNNSLIAILALLAIFASFFFLSNYNANKKALEVAQKKESKLGKIRQTLDGLDIKASAVSVYDLDENEKIYSKNDTVPLPIASIAKIMTVFTALNQHGEKKELWISSSAVSENGDYGLLVGEIWNLEDLARFTLVASANDGAYALAESENDRDVFLEKMNEKTIKIGMKQSFFLNTTGLDIDGEKAGAYASAEDVNVMAIHAFKLYPEIFSVTVMPEISLRSVSGFEHTVINTDTAIDKIPGLLFSKTGYTTLADGNLVIILKIKEGSKIAVTVLGSTYQGRFTDMEKIANVLYNFTDESGE